MRLVNSLTSIPSAYSTILGDFVHILGLLPASIRLSISYFSSWFSTLAEEVESLFGLALLVVVRRLQGDAQDAEKGDNTGDLLSKFQEARDENGKPLGINELADEIMVMVIAGSGM